MHLDPAGDVDACVAGLRHELERVPTGFLPNLVTLEEAVAQVVEPDPCDLCPTGVQTQTMLCGSPS